MKEPQPALLTIIASTSSNAKASRFRRASPLASRNSPLCPISEPQHTCERGVTTSQPFANNTSTVSRLMSAYATSCTQPVSNPTQYFRFVVGDSVSFIRSKEKHLRIQEPGQHEAASPQIGVASASQTTNAKQVSGRDSV